MTPRATPTRIRSRTLDADRSRRLVHAHGLSTTNLRLLERRPTRRHCSRSFEPVTKPPGSALPAGPEGPTVHAHPDSSENGEAVRTGPPRDLRRGPDLVPYRSHSMNPTAENGATRPTATPRQTIPTLGPFEAFASQPSVSVRPRRDPPHQLPNPFEVRKRAKADRAVGLSGANRRSDRTTSEPLTTSLPRESRS